MSALVSVRSSLTYVQQREASAHEQVKQAVQMTEEANFEKTKASLIGLEKKHAIIALFFPEFFFGYSSITRLFTKHTK